jgi:phage/plasmid-like protein (TIGR03299 family)
MAHNIALNTVNGQSMVFTAGKLPWHNLGQNVRDAQTWEQAIKLANLDWEVIEAPLYTQWSQSGLIQAEGFKVLVRKDTKQTLGVHGMGYTPFQNVQAFEFADALIENGALFESAGGLGNGERIWCLARVPSADFTVGQNDRHEMYLLVATSHDGSLATTVTVTDVRVVCQNTLTAALGMGNSKAEGKLKIKHTKSADMKIEQAKRMISGTIQTAETLRDKLTNLANVKLSKDTYTAIVDKLFPIAKDASKVSVTRRENMLSEILASYQLNDSNAYPEQAGTAYALLNAITDYTDHLRGTRRTDGQNEQAARSESALFGSGNQLKSNALETIYDLVGADGRVISTSQSNKTSGGLLDAILSQN